MTDWLAMRKPHYKKVIAEGHVGRKITLFTLAKAWGKSEHSSRLAKKAAIEFED